LSISPAAGSEQFFAISPRLEEFSKYSPNLEFWSTFPLSPAVHFYIEEFIRKHDPSKTLFSLRVEEALMSFIEEYRIIATQVKEIKDVFCTLQKWTDLFFAYGNVPADFYEPIIGDLFKKILGACMLNAHQNQFVEPTVNILKALLKDPKVQRDYSALNKCKEMLEPILEYVSGSMLSFFFEVFFF
jgi:hypothetical protein